MSSRPPRLIAVDLETRAPLNLKKVGLTRYAHAAMLDVCAYQVLEQVPNSPDNWEVIHSGEGLGKPAHGAWLEALAHFSAGEGDALVAHNAAFERTVLHALGHRVPEPACWIDTMMIAQYLNLPASLDALSKKMLGETKDTKGHDLMRYRAADALTGQTGLFEDGDDLRRLADYCAKDADLSGRLAVVLLPYVGGIHGKRIRDETTSHLIVNETGMPIDAALIDSVAGQADLYARKWNVGIRRDTSFGYDPTQKAKLCKWLEEKGIKPASKEAKDLAAAVGEADDESRAAVEYCIAASSTSTRKWEVMRQVQHKGRLTNHLVYCKQTTGRWAGSKAQVQNFPKPGQGNEEARQDAEQIGSPLPEGWEPRRVARALKTGLRRAIRAPVGMRLVKVDYSQIELRALLWHCNLNRDLNSLHEGADLYRELAGDIFGRKPADVSKPQRDVGKMAILAAGYGVGADTLGKQMTDGGVENAERMAPVALRAYHDRWPEVKEYWRSCGEAFDAGKGSGPHWSASTRTVQGRKGLVITLPSKRPLVLWEAGMHWFEQFQKTMRGAYAGDALRAYHPHTVAQNITSATARDILADAIIRIQQCCRLSGKDECLHAARVVGHVHDEIIVEVRSSVVDLASKEISSIMEEPPDWLADFPLKTEATHGERWNG